MTHGEPPDPGANGLGLPPDHAFALAPELAAIGLSLGDFALSRVFLVEDGRFPWLMLVPRRANAREILDLSREDRRLLYGEIERAMAAMQRVAAPDKLNFGALGNVVAQLHVHIVGRFFSDPAWPGPVWGFGTPAPYPPHVAGITADRFRAALGLDAP